MKIFKGVNTMKIFLYTGLFISNLISICILIIVGYELIINNPTLILERVGKSLIVIGIIQFINMNVIANKMS
jgi:hypothetical protein